MIKTPFFRSYWLRLCLELLAWETVVMGVAWLIYHAVSGRQPNFRFGDSLILVGVLEIAMASAAMMGRPFEVSGPYGVPALPVRPSEQDQRAQMVEEFLEKKRFATRLIATGLVTVLLAVILTYTVY